MKRSIFNKFKTLCETWGAEVLVNSFLGYSYKTTVIPKTRCRNIKMIYKTSKKHIELYYKDCLLDVISYDKEIKDFFSSLNELPHIKVTDYTLRRLTCDFLKLK